MPISFYMHLYLLSLHVDVKTYTVLPAESDSEVMYCLQSYQALIIDRSLVY